MYNIYLEEKRKKEKDALYQKEQEMRKYKAKYNSKK